MEEAMNIAVVVGDVKGEVHTNEREDGVVIVSFDVRVRVNDDTRAETVPVSWMGQTERAPTFDDGAVVTVIGSLRRHFYRRGGSTVSRTDLLAERIMVGPPSRSKSARSKVADRLLET